MKKFVIICLRVTAVLSGLVGSGIMILCASGWRYHFHEGNYPAVFHVWSFWMYAGAVLIIMSLLCCMLAIRRKYYILNFFAILFSISGYLVCMLVLSEFCDYADRNFSGIGDSMQPVSELYQNRIEWILFPVLLIIGLSVWQFFRSKTYRIQKYQRKIAEENAEAPKILED